MSEIVVIAHNIRSTHNVGSFFRTCDGFGAAHLFLTGYTPYPRLAEDSRLPHISNKLTAQIHKTALGAEESVPFSYTENPIELITRLKSEGYTMLALEQTPQSVMLPDYNNIPEKCALILGEEVHGIPGEVLSLADVKLEIPMVGKKESFNVSVSLGVALYALIC